MSQLADNQQNDLHNIQAGEIEVDSIATNETPENIETPETPGQDDAKQKPIFTKDQQEHLNRLINDTIRRERERADERVEEAKKTQGMDEAERAEHERKKLEQERDEALARIKRFELGTTATSQLISEGLAADNETLEFVIRDTERETTEAVEQFSKLVKEQAKKLLNQQLSGKPPKKSTGTGSAITREQIAKVSDPVERHKLIQENPHLYT